MSTYLLVSTNPLPGMQDEFNDWYTHVHLGEVLKVEGFLSAQRFKLSDVQVIKNQPHSYFTLYEIDGADTAAVLQRLQSALPTMQLKPVMDADSTQMVVFDSITDLVR